MAFHCHETCVSERERELNLGFCVFVVILSKFVIWRQRWKKIVDQELELKGLKTWFFFQNVKLHNFLNNKRGLSCRPVTIATSLWLAANLLMTRITTPVTKFEWQRLASLSSSPRGLKADCVEKLDLFLFIYCSKGPRNCLYDRWTTANDVLSHC